MLTTGCRYWKYDNLPITVEGYANQIMKLTDSNAGDDAKPKPRSKWRRRLLFLTLILAAIAAWGAYDLYGPRTSHMRDFDADEVAHLETAMWRSYYDKQQVRLFNQLAELLRTQY